jgi:mono/diheme cytochrome c family protein
MNRLFLPHGIVLGVLLAVGGRAAGAAPADLGRDALLLFQSRCGRCHSADKPKGKLDLSTPESIRRGGRHGPVLTAGRPDASRLWLLVRDGRMPPKEPLADGERDLVRRWIVGGAPAPRTATTHWAFRPLVRPPVPAVRRSDRVRTVIDRSIEAALEKKGLSIGPEADRATLLRRVTFGLTGLPPTPTEIDAFRADPAPDAYEKVVDRLLASPHYGERWGKYWLDAAGYADSNGYFSADTDRPLAYHYRDYVIRAFNQDRPYDRFVREQLAGDELAGYTPGGDVGPATAELLTATHFLRDAPDGTGESDGNPDEVRTDRFSVLEGDLQITMNCLLGVTIQCARCHDHKFEPITQEEYYRLQAILYPAYCPDRWVKPNDRVVTAGSRARREKVKRQTERIDRQVKALRDGLRTMAGPLREQLLDERLRQLPAADRAALAKAADTPKDKRTPPPAELVQKHPEAQVGDDDLARRFPEYAAVREQVRRAIAARDKERPPPLERIAVLIETNPNPPVHHVLIRGQHNAPGPEVQPGVPAALTLPGNAFRVVPRPAGEVGSGRRTAFARWVTSPQNPLFARVLVNRVWQHHFGIGLVATPDNLGRSGARPSHPELLDDLAVEFVRSGWSIKALHRRIVTSAVYRQESAASAEAVRADPDDRLLSRFPLRRLDAEALRDGLLAVSGELDGRMSGPYVPTTRRPDGSVEVDEGRDGARRRSVYLQQRRTQVATLLELFDAPSMATTCAARTTSTVPLQSLALLNAPFVRARARSFAVRLEREAGPDADNRLTLAFRLAAGREPGGEERAAARRFLATQRALYAGDRDGDRRAWTDLCQMVLASNAFLYVE